MLCYCLAVHFRLTHDIFAVLYKYLNCAADKGIDAGHTAITTVTVNYRIILLCYLLLPGASLDMSLCQLCQIWPTVQLKYSVRWGAIRK